MTDEHLRVALVASADAYGQCRRALRDGGCNVGRHALQRYGKGSCLLHGLCVFHELSGRVLRLALHLVSSQSVERLRRKADVGDDGYSRIHDGTYAVGIHGTSLQLHCLAVGLLHDASRIADGIVHRGLIRHKGHVDDNEGVLRPAAYRPAMVYHIFYGHGKGVVISEDDIAKRVADKDHVDARLVDDTGRMVVIGSEHAEHALALLLLIICSCMFHFSVQKYCKMR